MAGVCQHCGEVFRELHSCPVCGSSVCANCLEEYGCEICHGRETMEGPDEDENPGYSHTEM